VSPTGSPGPPVITGGVEVGGNEITGTGQPRPTPNSCIQICLADVPSIPSTPPCTGADTVLGTGGTNAAGQFVDAGGMPGIAISPPLANGDCVYAFDQCAMQRSAVQCATLPAPAPLLSRWAWFAALATLLGSAFTAFRRRMRG
jgi:hypothetical protein